MYKTFREAGISLVVIATVVLLLAPSAMARSDRDRGDIVGMDFRANYGGGVVGKVQDVRGGDVIVALNDGGNVTVPMRDVSVSKEHGYVLFQGSKRELYSMADNNRRDYSRDRYRDDRYRDDRDRGYYGDRYGDRYNDQYRYNDRRYNDRNDQGDSLIDRFLH